MAVYYTSVNCNPLTPLLRLLWICTTCFYSYVDKILTRGPYAAAELLVTLKLDNVLQLNKLLSNLSVTERPRYAVVGK